MPRTERSQAGPRTISRRQRNSSPQAPPKPRPPWRACRTSRRTAAQKDAAAWDGLLATAKTGRPFEELTTAALVLRHSLSARRLRADEIYQDRLHQLAAAAGREPKSADRLTDVAEFLRDKNDVAGLRVSLNGAVHYFRRQTPEQAGWERELAFQLTTEALNAEPQHVLPGLCGSSLFLHENKLEEADQAAHAAVRFGPRVVSAHMALSDCDKVHAAAAGGSRQTADAQNGLPYRESRQSVWTADPDPVATLSHSPESGGPPRAAECDRQAANYSEQERICLSNALESAKGTKDEPYYQALMLYLKQDYADAKPWLEKAILARPDDPKLHRSLSGCLSALGQTKEATEEFSRAIDLEQTTAEVWLNIAWASLEHADQKTARESLLRARDADPADTRVAAYWGVLAELDAKDTTGPDAAFQTALRRKRPARDDQTTFLPTKGPAIPLSPEDLGLTFMLRLKAARAVFRTKPEQAAEYYLANVAAERRMSDWNLAKSVFSAMLPVPNRDAKQAPTPMPLVAVLKNNRIFAGQALLNAGRPQDAARQFAAAENFANRLPDGGTAYLEFRAGAAVRPVPRLVHADLRETPERGTARAKGHERPRPYGTATSPLLPRQPHPGAADHGRRPDPRPLRETGPGGGVAVIPYAVLFLVTPG